MALDGNLEVVAGGARIHPHACVHGDCEIGTRTYIWQFASVIRGAKIGDDCSIASSAIVDGARLGDRVIVGHGAFVGPGTRIGNSVFIGPNVTVCNDYWPQVTKDGWFKVDDLISGKIVVVAIGDNASIGAGAVLLPGIVVGARAMIAGGAVVDKDVPPLALFKRDGHIAELDPKRVPNRMRSVTARC